MSPAMAWTASAVVVIAAVPFLVHAVAYAGAAAAKRRARRGCPFEDDDHDTLPGRRAIQLVVTESLLWWYAVLTAARRPPRRPPSPAVGTPVIVLSPPGLPRSCIVPIARRLEADGFWVITARWTPFARSQAARLRALDRALRSVWDDTGARIVDLIAPAGAAAIAAAHLAHGGSGVPATRRLLVVGAPAAPDAVPPPTELIAFCSYDDPWLGPVERARWPGAVTVAIRGFGRLGLLHAPYVYGLVREHLLAPVSSRPLAWTNAVS